MSLCVAPAWQHTVVRRQLSNCCQPQTGKDFKLAKPAIQLDTVTNSSNTKAFLPFFFKQVDAWKEARADRWRSMMPNHWQAHMEDLQKLLKSPAAKNDRPGLVYVIPNPK